MRANRATYPIATMCRLLGVSASGYHAWQGRRPSVRDASNAALLERIGKIHTASRGTYGAPRIHAELAADDDDQETQTVARPCPGCGGRMIVI